MKCPKCNTLTLVEKQIKGVAVRVDQCRTCGGLWFDGGELEQSLDVAAEELTVPARATKTNRVCPDCQVELYRFNYPQTYSKIDMCKKCDGLWLDRNEFKEIKMVRQHLKKKGTLEEKAPVTGVKGGLIDLINKAIESLT